jgi:RNA polymerase sigma-70 factor (ECF subfamily)
MDGKCVSASQDISSLFREHAGFVKAFLRKLGISELGVDDAVQDVFLVADRHGGYRAGPASPRTWLGEIAIRVAANARRKSTRISTIPVELVLQLNGNSVPSDVLLIQREELARVDRALRALPADLYAVFASFYVNGESCDIISAALKIPVGTVYSRLHAARYFVIAHIRDSEPL